MAEQGIKTQDQIVEPDLAVKIVYRIEQELEELKDVLHGRGIQFQTMSNDERQERHTRRHTNVDGSPDKRFKENREGPTGQGEVKNPMTDQRLTANR